MDACTLYVAVIVPSDTIHLSGRVTAVSQWQTTVLAVLALSQTMLLTRQELALLP